MKDLLYGKKLEMKFDDQPNSFVRLVDCMPRVIPDDVMTGTGDFAVVQAARVSYQGGTTKASDDRTLLRYLLRHYHTTPFENCELKWHMSMPIFIARQFIRHRTANVNEESGRYSVMKEKFYVPTIENMRKQSNKNKQGGNEPMDAVTAQELIDSETEHDRRCYELYQKRIAAGMARELARDVLPLNLYTSWYWKNDMWNTMNFLRLRMDSHAQYEIRELAGAMYQIIQPLFPDCMEAFDDYVNMDNVVRLTRLDKTIVSAITAAHHWSEDQADAGEIKQRWQQVEQIAAGFGWLERKEDGSLRENRERAECEAKLAQLGLRHPW